MNESINGKSIKSKLEFILKIRRKKKGQNKMNVKPSKNQVWKMNTWAFLTKVYKEW